MTTETLTRGALPRVQWSPVITGVLCALAAHIVLGLFGVAFGFSADPADSTGLGVLAGVWALVVPLVASAIGAFVCVRIAREAEPAGAFLHGAIVWCIGLVAGALFLGSTMATSALSSAAATAGNVRGGLASDATPGRSARTEARVEDAQRTAAAFAGAGGVGALLGLAGALLGAAAARGALTGRGLSGGRFQGRGLRDRMPFRGAGRDESDYDRGYRAGFGAAAGREEPRSGVVTSSTGRAPEVTRSEVRPEDDPTLHH